MAAVSSPKPFRICCGDSNPSSADVSPVEASLPSEEETLAGVERSTTRRSISTNRPDIGRFDQSEFAVTWKSTSWPFPCLAALTSGVPSLRRAQMALSAFFEGSVSTWRFTKMSWDGWSPLNGLPSSKGASGWGVLQDSDPPKVRPPCRSGCGNRLSPPCSSRGPANRISVPPWSTHFSRSSNVPPTSFPMSASIRTETLRWSIERMAVTRLRSWLEIVSA